MDEKRSSKDRLLQSVMDLMAAKGYHAVTTKEIAAAAGVSEMTLFRRFGSKRALLESAVDHFYYTEDMRHLFHEKLAWDLRSDLCLLADHYHESMNRNRKLIRIVLRDAEMTDIAMKAQKHPRQLKEMLTDYFSKMQGKGKMIAVNPEAQAMNFMWMNYGAFMTGLFQADSITGITLQEFKESSVDLFVRALTP